MPGLFGIAGPGAARVTGGQKLLDAAMDLLVRESGHKIIDSTLTPTLAAGCVSAYHNLQVQSVIHLNNKLSVWADGEIYGHSKTLSSEEASDAGIARHIAEHYIADPELTFLKNVDGVFSAVIHDMARNQVHLVTDRLGFRQLYWSVMHRHLVWASESKAFLAVPGFTVDVDHKSLKQLLVIGHLLGNHSMLRGIELLPPSSILTFDCTTGMIIAKRRYWHWSTISSAHPSPTMHEAAEEAGARFQAAIIRRISDKLVPGVTLSGGLDSRAIFSALAIQGLQPPTLTFGQHGCADSIYARHVAERGGGLHLEAEVSSMSWLNHRFESVWITDGQCDLLHMHGTASNGLNRYADFNMNGFIGDLVLGGSWLEHPDLCDKPPTTDLAAQRFHSNPELLADMDPFVLTNKTDPYFINVRARRFTAEGTRLVQERLHQRLPFVDNALLEFIYSLPDKYRYGNRLYRTMLLHRYPRWYRHIPWQKYGAPLSWPHFALRTHRIAHRQLARLTPLQRFWPPLAYTNYAAWLRAEPARSLFTELLTGQDALHTNYLDHHMARNALHRHWQGTDESNLICRLLTFEIWLRQANAACQRFRN